MTQEEAIEILEKIARDPNSEHLRRSRRIQAAPPPPSQGLLNTRLQHG
jgi:hypothetical protein